MKTDSIGTSSEFLWGHGILWNNDGTMFLHVASMYMYRFGLEKRNEDLSWIYFFGRWWMNSWSSSVVTAQFSHRIILGLRQCGDQKPRIQGCSTRSPIDRSWKCHTCFPISSHPADKSYPRHLCWRGKKETWQLPLITINWLPSMLPMTIDYHRLYINHSSYLKWRLIIPRKQDFTHPKVLKTSPRPTFELSSGACHPFIPAKNAPV